MLNKAGLEIVLDRGKKVQAGKTLEGYVGVFVKRGTIQASSLELDFSGTEYSEVKYEVGSDKDKAQHRLTDEDSGDEDGYFSSQEDHSEKSNGAPSEEEEDDDDDEDDEQSRMQAPREQKRRESFLGPVKKVLIKTDSKKKKLINLLVPPNDLDLSFIGEDGKVEKGEYRVPFKFDLPAKLPPSMQRGESTTGCCFVHYILHATLKGSGALEGMLDDTYETSYPVTLLSKPMKQRPPKPYRVDPATERVSKFCFNTGSITFAAKLDDTQLSPGSPCNITLACHNYTSTDVKKVEAKLIQEISWKGRKRRSDVWRETIAVVKLPTAPPKQGRAKNTAQVENELVEDLSSAIEAEAPSGTITVPLTTAGKVIDSFKGTLVKVMHKIEIHVVTGFGATNISSSIPVRIGQAPEPESKTKGERTPHPELEDANAKEEKDESESSNKKKKKKSSSSKKKDKEKKEKENDHDNSENDADDPNADIPSSKKSKKSKKKKDELSSRDSGSAEEEKKSKKKKSKKKSKKKEKEDPMRDDSIAENE